MSNPQLDAATARLARNMAIAQVAIDTNCYATLFILQVEAVESALNQMRRAMEAAGPEDRITPPGMRISPGIADLLAEHAFDSVPDNVPPSWKE